MDLKELEILGEGIDKHWYYCSKSKAMMQYIKNLKSLKILDVGAGSGYFSKQVLRNSAAVEATCVDPSYEIETEEVFNCKRIAYKKEIQECDADLSLFMDVLEHVEDDVGLLKLYKDKLSSGAHIFITVPAFEFLWSSHDVFLDHKRRYTVGSLERAVKGAGLEIINTSYYFGSVFPIAATLRIIDKFLSRSKKLPKSNLKQHSSVVNYILKKMCLVELPLLEKNRLFGLSVICLAKVK